jgi:lipopolysaccharide/colanic/teichoic acid biosynthesis glycosyltransferase
MTLGVDTHITSELEPRVGLVTGSLRPSWLSYESLAKRSLDILLAAAGLILLAPLLLAVALVIRVESPGPSVFRQRRVGLGQREFEMFKFRSMYLGAEAHIDSLWTLNEVEGPVFKMRNDPRVTRLGRFIRRTKIDEVPQLINVLRGEMSLVGPRPPLPREVAAYRESDLFRLTVKPGLTCIWQVRGRRETSFDEWMELDREYIQKMSLAMDLRLMLATVVVVFGGNGGY